VGASDGGEHRSRKHARSRKSFFVPVRCQLADEADIEITDIAPFRDDGEGRQILLVEDVADIRHYLTDLLTARVYRNGRANGREALHSAGQITGKLAALLRSSMPEMDGWSLLRALRSQYDPSLPVILFSAISPQPQKTGRLIYSSMRIA